MTVGELIDKLKEINPEYEVFIFDVTDDYTAVIESVIFKEGEAVYLKEIK